MGHNSARTTSSSNQLIAETVEPKRLQLGHDLLDDASAVNEAENKTAIHKLAWHNAKLRRKLCRTKVRNQEQIDRVQWDCDKLRSENNALRHERESLRACFLQQQQEQIAFWTGPSMDILNTNKYCRIGNQE